MARIRVFPPQFSEKQDSPGFISRSAADFLVRTRRCFRQKDGSIRHHRPADLAVAMGGYDHSVTQGAASDFRQVWEMRESAGVQMWQYTANSERRKEL